jgi:hypothetical protein
MNVEIWMAGAAILAVTAAAVRWCRLEISSLRHAARIFQQEIQRERSLREGAERMLAARIDVQATIYQERDRWRDLYQEQATAHGVAQDMLMRERDVLIRQIESAHLAPKTDAVVDRVVESFHAAHGRALVQRRIEQGNPSIQEVVE